MDIIPGLAKKTCLTSEDVQLMREISKENLKDWMRSLSEEDSCLNNLEILLHLHDYDKLQITTYVHFCQDLTSLGDLICLYVTSSNEDELKIGSDVLCVLMCTQESVSSYDKSCTLLDQIIKYLSSSLINNTKPISPLVPHLTQSKHKIHFILNMFLVDIVNEALSVNEPCGEHLYSVANQQRRNHTHLRQQGLFEFVKEVVKVLPSTQSFQMIETNFNETTTNFDAFLILISAYLDSGETHMSTLLDFIGSTFKSSLANQDESLTLKSLLLIRQCCLDKIKPVYTSYAHWFSNLPIRSKVEFEFLFRVLSELVPHENATDLKIHVNKAPSIPPNCQAPYFEYSQLAKTRLKDMNETVEYLGLFGTTDLEDRMEDVRKVLSHFAATNEIADIVLKACVFRRDYYQDIFLRDLLNLRDPALTALQIRLVDKLHQVGKLPHGMYDEWSLKR